MTTRPSEIVRATASVATRLLGHAGGRAVRIVTGHLSLLDHVGVVLVSAAIASTLPFTFADLAQRLLVYWSAIQDEKVFLVSTEVAVALLLVLAPDQARANWTNWRLVVHALDRSRDPGIRLPDRRAGIPGRGREGDRAGPVAGV